MQQLTVKLLIEAGSQIEAGSVVIFTYYNETHKSWQKCKVK